MSAQTHILICGVNWLGDACMTMPALQAFHAHEPDSRITMLTRPALEPLWAMHPAVDATIALVPTISGMREAIARLRDSAPHAAYIFPNSWRSALVPFFAHIPRRVGQRGHHRGMLLTETTQPSQRAAEGHQQWEYVDILQVPDVMELPYPVLTVPEDAAAAVNATIPTEAGTTWLGILPGAARGPSKQWPAAHFVAAARQIASQHPCRYAILGTAGEAELCEGIAAELGDPAVSLAGKTSLPELVAVLARCNVVLCNDSGGMHLAAATGTPVVAMYGITDPHKTGPIGDGHALICAEGVAVSRSVPRDSQEARDALQSITPNRVAQATLAILSNQPQTS